MTWLRTLVAGLLLAAAPLAAAEMRVVWEDAFEPAEQVRLTAWAQQVLDSVEAVTARLPFDVYVHFHRATSSREPVPWANTSRGRRQSVHFHVSPRFDDRAFIDDWTAPHEFSHLLIPYLGRRHSWFAEGFASYMQYQVMQHMGVLTADQVVTRYSERMARAERRFDLDHVPFVHAAPQLRASGRYPTMYWGGAVLFLRWDARLRSEHDTTLGRVLADYLQCCRMHAGGLDGLVAALDSASATRVFSDEYARFRDTRGFPQWQASMEVLARHQALAQLPPATPERG